MDTVQAFVDSMDGDDVAQPVPAQRFMENLLGCEVGESTMRKLFNAFHSDCPNFKVGEDDCPDCIARHGFR